MLMSLRRSLPSTSSSLTLLLSTRFTFGSFGSPSSTSVSIPVRSLSSWTRNLPFGRSQPLRKRVSPARVTPTLVVPPEIPRPSYFTLATEPYTISVKKSVKEIEATRTSCRLAKKFLNFAGTLIQPGITTDEIDRIVHEAMIKEGVHPTPLGYPGEDVPPFPKSICTSVNEILGHGIPDLRPLEKGDVISIDVSLYFNGFHGDTCGTFYVGDLSTDPSSSLLIDTARQATETGVAACRPGLPINVIGAAIETFIDSTKQFSVSPYLTGHGIGPELHLPPIICHTHNNAEEIMVPGLTFTIEPVVIESKSYRAASMVGRWKDGWTLYPGDKISRSAQFEHTVLITQDGYEILTYDPESEESRQTVFKF